MPRKKKKTRVVVKKDSPREILLQNPENPQSAIACFCWECSGENKAEVERCQFLECALYSLRETWL